MEGTYRGLLCVSVYMPKLTKWNYWVDLKETSISKITITVLPLFITFLLICLMYAVTSLVAFGWYIELTFGLCSTPNKGYNDLYIHLDRQFIFSVHQDICTQPSECDTVSESCYQNLNFKVSLRKLGI